MTLAHATIVAWDSKYFDDFWCPITAIQNGGTDGNAATIADPKWQPLVETCRGRNKTGQRRFKTGLGDADYDGVFDTTRSEPGFMVAAEEAGMSRIFGGNHFMSGNVDGLEIVGKVADFVLINDLQPVPEPSGVMLVRLGSVFLHSEENAQSLPIIALNRARLRHRVAISRRIYYGFQICRRKDKGSVEFFPPR